MILNQKFKDNDIVVKSFDFAVRIVNFSKFLMGNKKEYIISKQIFRSATSIGANIREAQQAESLSDFIHKLSVSLKESVETQYWLELLFATNYINLAQFNSLNDDLEEIIKLLNAIIKTTKQKNAKNNTNY